MQPSHQSDCPCLHFQSMLEHVHCFFLIIYRVCLNYFFRVLHPKPPSPAGATKTMCKDFLNWAWRSQTTAVTGTSVNFSSKRVQGYSCVLLQIKPAQCQGAGGQWLPEPDSHFKKRLPKNQANFPSCACIIREMSKFSFLWQLSIYWLADWDNQVDHQGTRSLVCNLISNPTTKVWSGKCRQSNADSEQTKTNWWQLDKVYYSNHDANKVCNSNYDANKKDLNHSMWIFL